MFVTGSTGIFVAFDSSGPGGTGNLASEVVVHFVAECLGYFSEIVSDGHYPNPPLYFYKLRNSVPIHISLPLVLQQLWGLPVLGVVALSLWEDLKWMQEGWPVLPQLNQIS